MRLSCRTLASAVSPMTLDQTLAFAVLAGMMALFIWGRLRYDLVGHLLLNLAF